MEENVTTIKGSVKLEIRPLQCPLQRITCADCKYLQGTDIEMNAEGRLEAEIYCNSHNHIIANI